MDEQIIQDILTEVFSSLEPLDAQTRAALCRIAARCCRKSFTTIRGTIPRPQFEGRIEGKRKANRRSGFATAHPERIDRAERSKAERFQAERSKAERTKRARRGKNRRRKNRRLIVRA